MKAIKAVFWAFTLVWLFEVASGAGAGQLNLTETKLTEKQLWAIALTGIMTEANRCSHITLNFYNQDEDSRRGVLTLLKRDWGINNREELLKTLKYMESNGHAVIFDMIKQIIIENNNMDKIKEEWRPKLRDRDYNYLLFTLQQWEVYKDISSIKSWDWGRNISLCRWGYEVGFLTETEAWDLIMYYAKLIQPLYSSWQEYGFSYTMGRIFWASGFKAEERYTTQTIPIFDKLMKGEVGQWHNLRWSIDLR